MFEVHPVELRDLLKQVEAGDIQLPDFQRGWVWDDEQVKKLLGSVSRGYPIGTILTLVPGPHLQFQARAIEGIELDGEVEPKAYLLDGQQRITTLYQALNHPDLPVEMKGAKRWYYIDLVKARKKEDSIVSVSASKKLSRGDSSPESFLLQVMRSEGDSTLELLKHCIPTEELLNSGGWKRDYIHFWQSIRQPHPEGDASALMEWCEEHVFEHFRQAKVPEIRLGGSFDKQAVCSIFELVNSTGKKLTQFELLVASFSADNFQLRDEWGKRKQQLSDKSELLVDVTPDMFAQAMVLVVDRQQTETGKEKAKSTPKNDKLSILSLTADDYIEWVEEVEEGFYKAAEFLVRQCVFASKDIPYPIQLATLAALYVIMGDELESIDAQEKLEQWYWAGIFGGTGKRLDGELGSDTIEFPEYVRDGAVPRSISELGFQPEKLLSLRTRASAAYKGLYALLMKSGALSWKSKSRVNFDIWDNEKIDIRHIFPKKMLQKRGVSAKLADSIINKTPMSADIVKRLGVNAPSMLVRLLNLKKDEIDEILESHCIDPGALRDDDFEDFFIKRGKALMELIGDAVGKELDSGREAFEKAIEQNA